jgi:hypothetical protein
VKVETFKIEHLDRIKPLGGEQIKEFARAELGVASSNKLAFTVFAGDKIISICGVILFWDGVGEAFTIMCEDIKKYGLSLYKAYKVNINTIFKALKLRRLQATVAVELDEGVRFIERLGFKREGIMRKWTPDGKDVYMYSLVEGG